VPDFIENTPSAPELVVQPRDVKDTKPAELLHPHRSHSVTFATMKEVAATPNRLLSNASSNSSNPRSPVYSDQSSDYGNSVASDIFSNPPSPGAAPATALVKNTPRSITSSTRKSKRLTFLPSLWGSPSESKTPLPDTMAFGFSVSGKSLFLWLRRDCEFLMKMDAPFQTARRYSLLSGKMTRPAGAVVKLLAGTDQRIAVLAEYHGEVRQTHQDY
jgi:hypothetical protein